MSRARDPSCDPSPPRHAGTPAVGVGSASAFSGSIRAAVRRREKDGARHRARLLADLEICLGRRDLVMLKDGALENLPLEAACAGFPTADLEAFLAEVRQFSFSRLLDRARAFVARASDEAPG